MKVLGPTITDNVFVIRSRKKMASLEHFKCSGSENVTSFIVMVKTEASHEQGIYIKNNIAVIDTMCYKKKTYTASCSKSSFLALSCADTIQTINEVPTFHHF